MSPKLHAPARVPFASVRLAPLPPSSALYAYISELRKALSAAARAERLSHDLARAAVELKREACDRE